MLFNVRRLTPNIRIKLEQEKRTQFRSAETFKIKELTDELKQFEKVAVATIQRK